MKFGKKKISTKIIKLISSKFLNVEESLFKLVMYMIDFETGGLTGTTIRVKELMQDGIVRDRLITKKEDFLEIIFLPLEEFERRYKGIIDENGNEYGNSALVDYRNKAHQKYERMAGRLVAVSLITFGIGVFSNWVSNFIPT